MEKERFLALTRNYTSLTQEETKNLNELQRQYPYSQVIHNLASRGAQDHQLSSSKNLLSISAVYSTDRSVLKNIITAPRTERREDGQTETPPVHNQVTVVSNEQLNPVSGETHIQKTDTSAFTVDEALDALHDEALNREIMSDLNKLQQLKHDFETSVEEFQHYKDSRPAKEKLTSKESKSHISAVQKKSQEAAAEANDSLPLDKGPVGEVLLEEIKSKKKVIPESQKQKEQIEIIDQFIKKQPSIQKSLGSSHDASDLAERNFALTENLVSETLVEILLKQGKKDKAIEVLKKLIWKFPQKKAIFAAQIDELKK